MFNINGTLITRQWIDTRDGLLLRFWIKTPNGPLLVEQTNQEGIFFVEESQLQEAISLTKKLVHRTSSLNLKSFSQQSVTGFYFNNQRNLRSAASLLKNHGIEALEFDVRTVDRYLMERFITASMTVFAEKVHSKGRYNVVYNGNLKPAEIEPDFSVISFDIETSFNGKQLLSIAVYGSGVQIVFMQSYEPLKNCQIYEDERSLLIGFIDWIQVYDPDILIGWNCINFDLRFLEDVCQRLGVKFNLGRNNETLEWRTSGVNKEHYFVLIPGRVVLDGIDTLKTATYSFESFSLEFVSRELLGRGKLVYDPDDRGEEIMRLFQEDKQALADYNLEDCALVWDIFDKTNLIQFAFERAKLTGLPMDKVGGSVAAFENQYLPRLHRKGYVAPNLPDDPQGIGSPGGYVMDSQPGLYENVLVLDFKSLYPSIIRSFKIDPYGLAEGDRLVNRSELDGSIPLGNECYDVQQLSQGFRGAFFKKENSILPNLIENLWVARDKAKSERNGALSQSLKILMNSFYGVMGTPGCRFFDARLPSSITLRGHEIMLRTRELIEEEGYQVIYGDTDSIFVLLSKSVEQGQASEIGQQLVEKVNLWWKSHLVQKYQLVSALELEYESHYTKFLMPTLRGSNLGTKKRYAGLICQKGFAIDHPDKESYKIVFKGLESVRTDWTRLARDFQKELYERIFLNREYQSFIRKIVVEVKQGKHDNKLVYRKRLRRRLSEYQRNIPPHVQAARKADAWRVDQGKQERYKNGGWIEYYYTVNGPEAEECLLSRLDYELYLDRQILPIVDGIVSFLGTSYEEIAGNQMTLL